MRAKVLSILAVLVLAVSFSVIAQTTPQDPATPPAYDNSRPVDTDTDVDVTTTDSDNDGTKDTIGMTATERVDTDSGMNNDRDNDLVDNNDNDELPRTASPLALLALLGAGGAGSAAGLRWARRRR